MGRKYTIGEVSEITGINKRTLRYYDEKGLIVPFERDEINNYRHYSEQQIVDALMVREMRHRGFSMTEIKNLINSHDLEKVHQVLSDKVRSLEKKISELTDQLKYTQITRDLIDDAIVVCRNNVQPENNQITIDQMPEMTVLFDRRRSGVNANQLFWTRYNDLQMKREEENVTAAGPFSAIFYDHYFNQFFFEEGDFEVYLPILETDRVSNSIRKISPFRRASMTFVGWYADLLATYVELVKQIEQQGFKIAGPAYEEYLVEFSHGVPKDKCVTRVSFPIE